MDHNPVGWFEIPVIDMDRAKAFYQQLFGFEFEELMMGDQLMACFPMEEEAKGTSGALVKASGYRPSADGILIYFSAPQMQTMLTQVDALGGSIVISETAIGEHGFIAIVQDTEGNQIGLHRR